MVVRVIDRSSKYYDIFERTIKSVKRKLDVNYCFSTLRGSLTNGLANAATDIDIDIYIYIYKSLSASQKSETPTHIPDGIDLDADSGFGLGRPIDAAFFALDDIKHQDEHLRFRRHPNFPYDILPGDRNPNLYSAVTHSLGGGFVFDEERYLEKNYEFIANMLTVYDYLKHNYVNVRGKLDIHMSGELVRHRSYLETARELFCVEYVLRTNEYPPNHFLDLLELCDDTKAKSMLKDMFYENKTFTTHKTKNFIPRIDMLNGWLDSRLAFLLNAIKERWETHRNDLFELKLEY